MSRFFNEMHTLLMCAESVETKGDAGAIFPDECVVECDLRAQIVISAGRRIASLGDADFWLRRIIKHSIGYVYLSMIMNGLFKKVG
jgi:hypothetical protein